MIIIRKKIIALSLLILSISFVTFLSSKRTYTPQLVSSQLVEEKVVIVDAGHGRRRWSVQLLEMG